MFFNTAGSFGIEAYYPGDPNNGPATSPCEPLTVVKASPKISTTLSSGSITSGGIAFDTATLSGAYNPTGNVSFYLTKSCTVSVSKQELVNTEALTPGKSPSSISLPFDTPGT